MNKLTEIQNCIKTLLNPDQSNLDPFHTAADQLEDNKVWWITHLLSLLEEKDKALNDICMRTDEGSWVNHRASYALNTSSNNEGEL